VRATIADGRIRGIDTAATEAARLVQVDYVETEPVLDLDDPRAKLHANPWGLDQTHNPLGLFATVAFRDGGRLTVHDSTQWPHNLRAALAGAFGIAKNDVLD
jgi:CO/xanthine dehydrogenase Mo-binding subunit